MTLPPGFETTFPQEKEIDVLIVPPPAHPMAVARAFVAERHTDGHGALLLRHHRGDHYRFDGTCWPEVEDRRVRADLYHWLEAACYLDANGVPVPFAPNRHKIANLIDALHAVGHLDASVSAPAWLDADNGRCPAGEIVAMSNGLLHLPSRTLTPHEPAFFGQHALAFGFDPKGAGAETVAPLSV